MIHAFVILTLMITQPKTEDITMFSVQNQETPMKRYTGTSVRRNPLREFDDIASPMCSTRQRVDVHLIRKWNRRIVDRLFNPQDFVYILDFGDSVNCHCDSWIKQVFADELCSEDFARSGVFIDIFGGMFNNC